MWQREFREAGGIYMIFLKAKVKTMECVIGLAIANRGHVSSELHFQPRPLT